MPTKKFEELEHEVLQLPSESRANLAEKLIRSLEAEKDAEVETAWVQEAERRYRAIQNEDVTLLDADVVFHKVRAQL